MTELLGVIIGAALSYLFGQRQSRREERRRRDVVATALLNEHDWLQSDLLYLRDRWDRTSPPVVGLRTDVHDRFLEHITLFSAETAQTVLPFLWQLQDLRKAIDAMAPAIFHQDGHPAAPRVVKLAQRALDLSLAAGSSLLTAGGMPLDYITVPEYPAREQLERDGSGRVRAAWTRRDPDDPSQTGRPIV